MNSGRRQWKRSGGVLFTTLVLGATVAGADGTKDGYQSGQGTRVYAVAQAPFALEGVSLRPETATRQGVPLDKAWLEAGQFRGEQGAVALSGYDFINVSFSALVNNQTVTFRIREARPHRNVYTGRVSVTAWDYWVEWASQGELGSLCPGGAPALALPGRWSGGVFIPTEASDITVFSFSCQPYRTWDGDGMSELQRGGVGAKCADWGYPPWTNLDPMPDGRPAPSLPLEASLRHHVACTAMASADYCGEARPNTLNDTPIVMFDNGTVNTMQVDSSSQTLFVADGPFGSEHSAFFEAAWTTDPLVDPRLGTIRGYQARAMCLTKKRWSTLPLNGACSATQVSSQPVQDPRSARTEMKYCDDLSAEQLRAEGALLYSYSTYIDAGLYRFKKYGTTDEFVTTTVNIAQGHYPESYLPEGVTHPEEYELVGYEGTLLGRNVPKAFLNKQQPTVPLLLYTDGTRYLSGSDPAWVPQGFEPPVYADPLMGHVSTVPPKVPGQYRELHLWRNQGRHVTTTQDMSWYGFQYVGPMGFLPSMRDYASMQ